MSKRPGAFTLIELLIVVAIIAILAAIAVPNFLESQVRAKVSRSKADLYSLSVALDCYAIDWSVYPRGNFYQLAWPLSEDDPPERGLLLLTTPTAYLSTLPRDPFNTRAVYSSGGHIIEVDDDELLILQFYGYSARDAEGTVGTAGPPDYDTDSHSTQWWLLQSSAFQLHYHTVLLQLLVKLFLTRC